MSFGWGQWDRKCTSTIRDIANRESLVNRVIRMRLGKEVIRKPPKGHCQNPLGYYSKSQPGKGGVSGGVSLKQSKSLKDEEHHPPHCP